tara:strand:+ start:17120 stop:18238 length:1119 start_codon:yes stop_codon:yes gene_type:complete
MEVVHLNDLNLIRKKKNLDKVIIHAKNFKYSSLISYAIKFALWSLKDDGVLLIKNSNQNYVGRLVPNSYDFKLLIHKTASVLKDFGFQFSINKKEQEIEIVKQHIPFDNDWSLGIMFSGSINDYKMLVESINVYKDLKIKSDSKLEILVCGPASEREKFKDFDIRYIDYDEKNINPMRGKDNSRFLINQKKNHLIKQMLYSNCCVLHSRITLDKECLYNMPDHFDVIVPRIFYKHNNTFIPDNDLVFYKWNNTHEYVISAPNFRDYDRNNYLSHLKNRIPSVEGACLITKKDIFINNMLDGEIAWDEAEDVEWMKRIYQANKIFEISLYSKAFSSTTKMSKAALSMPTPIRFLLRRIYYYLKIIKSSILNHA